jgi:ribosomal protein S15P/S13E
MIQRYNLKSTYWVDTETNTSKISKEFEKDDNGEWVKWEDVKALIEENDHLIKHIVTAHTGTF